MLETERIRFEPLKVEYLDDLEKLFCENSLVMNSTLKGRVFTKLEFEEVIQTAFIKTKNDKYGFWCLTLIAEAKVIGVSGLHEFNYAGKESYELGFILNENYWGRGLATEIGNFWLDYAKKEMSLLELMATVKPTNTASRKVLEKLKMDHLGAYQSEERGDRLIYRKQL